MCYTEIGQNGFMAFVHRPIIQITRKYDVLDSVYVSIFRWGEWYIYSVESLRKS
jgi:hypothetical protein